MRLLDLSDTGAHGLGADPGWKHLVAYYISFGLRNNATFVSLFEDHYGGDV